MYLLYIVYVQLFAVNLSDLVRMMSLSECNTLISCILVLNQFICFQYIVSIVFQLSRFSCHYQRVIQILSQVVNFAMLITNVFQLCLYFCCSEEQISEFSSSFPVLSATNTNLLENVHLRTGSIYVLCECTYVHNINNNACENYSKHLCFFS